VTIARKDNIKRIYQLLPKLNCGLCGYDNCGQFARTVAEGNASPFGCRQNPRLGYILSEIIGAKVPVYSYGYQHAFVSGAGFNPTARAFKEEIRELLKKADDILIRIQDLKTRK
jgi:hypothetical protein